ncbi:retrovirus-related pol polyprotein from transposon TNT 1-94 [Tanacetum coccineum]
MDLHLTDGHNPLPTGSTICPDQGQKLDSESMTKKTSSNWLILKLKFILIGLSPTYLSHTQSDKPLPQEIWLPVKVGNTGARGKKVICYNCRGEGHVARQCKEPKRKMDSQYFKDKALLMEAKEKGDVFLMLKLNILA